MILVFFSGILGGFFSPKWGISIFFLLSFFSFTLFFRQIVIQLDSLIYFLFAIYSLVSSLWAPSKWGAILFSQALIGGALFLTLLRSRENLLRYVLYAILISGIVNCIFGFFQGFFGEAKGLFYNRNPYAGFLAPVLFLAISLFLEKKMSIIGYLIPFLFFSILLSGSRGGTYSTFLCTFIVLLYLAKRKRYEDLKALFFLLALGLLLFVLFLKVREGFLPVSYDFVEKGLTTDRWSKFRAYPYLLSGAPFFGYGMNSFYYIGDKISDPILNLFGHGHVHAHNIFFNVLLELGIFGFFLFASFLYVTLRDPTSSLISKMTLVSFLLPNLFEYNFPAPAFQVLFLSLCAYCAKGNRLFSISLAKRWFIFVLLFYLLFFSILPMLGDLLSKRGIESIRRQKPEEGFSTLLLSSQICWFCDEPPLIMARILDSALKIKGIEDEGAFRTVGELYMRALKMNRDVKLYVEIANFFFRAGKRDKAEDLLLKAYREYPFSLYLRTEMGKFYSAVGIYGKSLRFLFEVEDFYSSFDPMNPERLNVLSFIKRVYKEKGWQKASRAIEEKIQAIRSEKEHN